MKCPKCGDRMRAPVHYVNARGWTYRTRSCISCFHKFKTIEIPEHEIEIVEHINDANLFEH